MKTLNFQLSQTSPPLPKPGEERERKRERQSIAAERGERERDGKEEREEEKREKDKGERLGREERCTGGEGSALIESVLMDGSDSAF